MLRFLQLLIIASLVVGGFLVACGPALPHDGWFQGQPVPKWVKESCCGPADAHHLRPDQVRDNGSWYEVQGYDDPDGTPRRIPHGSELPSQDGHWWIFYKTYNDGSLSPVYCFFVPLSG